MGLLLYLIRKDEMNIYDIQIHRITSQYLEYVKNMKELDLEGAGEFVQMASSLLLIKSRMLLPHTDEKGEELENLDPRKELVRRLVEYEKFREASKQLGRRPLLNRDVFGRGTRESFDALEDLVTVDDGGLFQMISLYRNLLKKVNSGVHQVTQKFQTIASRILELKGRLRMGERIELKDLLAESEKHRDKLLITFLSMLELARLQLVSLFQVESYGNLHIEPRALFDESIVTHVQEYDAGVAGTPSVPQALISAPIEEIPATGAQQSLEALTEEDFLKAIADSESGESPCKAMTTDATSDMATDDEILQAERELGLVPDPDADFDKIVTDFEVEPTELHASSAAVIDASDELHFELDLSQEPVLPGMSSSSNLGETNMGSSDSQNAPRLFALPDPEGLSKEELSLDEKGDDWARIDHSLKRIEDQLDRMDWSEKSLHALTDVSALLVEDEITSEEETDLKSNGEAGSEPEPSQEI